jgi:ABC-type uncharacterized transport system permease subunit
MVSGITITCFAASYAVCLVLEASRLVFQAAVRNVIMRGFAAAGFLAHTLFLYGHARAELAGGVKIPLSNWHDFCLLAAWVLAGAYLGLSLRRPQLAVGVFLLPLVLVLIGAGRLLAGAAPFTTGEAASTWRWIHGIALLLGTAGVALGFATGVMHLVQSYRLKHKLPPNPRFRLPSLEWLQRFNFEALFISAGLLALGLIAGVVLNFGHRSGDSSAVPWSHPVVVSSGVLFLWIFAVLLFEAFYKPAREGHKVAYLTVGSFVFLGLVLYFVLFFDHAGGMVAASRRREWTFPDSGTSARPPVVGASDMRAGPGTGLAVGRRGLEWRNEVAGHRL